MISRLSYARFYLRILVLILPTLAFAIAGRIRFGFNLLLSPHNHLGLPSYWGLALLTTIAWAIVADDSGLWNIEQLYIPSGKSRRLLEALAFTYAIVMAASFFYRGASYSRTVVVISAVALFLLATLLRVLFRVILEWVSSSRSQARILIVGTGAYARTVANDLSHGQVLPGNVVGYVHLQGHPVEVERAKVYELGEIASLSHQQIDDIVIALSNEGVNELQAALPSLEQLCIPTRMAIGLAPGVIARSQLVDLGGIPMIDLQPTLAESPSYLFYKRTFDILLSLLVLGLAWPLMLAIALILKLEGEGPVFFRQDRVGLNGQVFNMLKFRSMKVGSSEDGDTRWTSENDPRRTRFGALLRKTNLDELPQFFNVLMGDMSVVGPRPERPFFVARFLKEFKKYNSRHLFKAGITGWAQVNGWRGDTSIAKRVEYDLYYLRNWSITFDLHIITLTCLRMFSSKNAY